MNFYAHRLINFAAAMLDETKQERFLVDVLFFRLFEAKAPEFSPVIGVLVSIFCLIPMIERSMGRRFGYRLAPG